MRTLVFLAPAVLRKDAQTEKSQRNAQSEDVIRQLLFLSTHRIDRRDDRLEVGIQAITRGDDLRPAAQA